MKALILANGELAQPDVLRARIQAAAFDLVLGVDGGARYAAPLGVALHAVVGDMDSLTAAQRQALPGVKLVTYPPEKDETDLELALLYAKEQGAEEMVIAGALGGRLDATAANLMLLASEGLQPSRLELWHGAQTAWVVRPPGVEITGQAGDMVSLVPLTGDVLGVTERGFKYPLHRARLPLGSARGVSNVLEKTAGHISLERGLLLVTHTPAAPGRGRPVPLNVSVQVLPLTEDALPIVDRAIQVIQASGVKYEVGPLETTLEGEDLDELLAVARAAHRACLAAGADRVVTIIKIAEAREGTSIAGKVGKYRQVTL